MGAVLDFLQAAWNFGPGRIRFATFTVPNVESIHEGFDWLAESWHRVLSGKVWGRMIAGGFRCFEVKPGKDGKWNVHLHAILLLWNPNESYKAMREAWDRATGLERANVRFDTLRNVKGRKGRSKAQAVAAYIAKYLVKVEDIAGAERAPGGLAHLADALQGRRLWAAWGVAAVARKWLRLAKPVWMDRARQWLDGYKGEAGESLEGAELVDTSTGEAIQLGNLRPWSGLFEGEPPDQFDLPPEALAFTWYSPGPLPRYRAHGKWIGWRAWWTMTQAERRPTRWKDHFRSIYRPKLDNEPSDIRQLDYSTAAFRPSVMLRAFIRRTFHDQVSKIGWRGAVQWADALPDHLRAFIHEREAYHGNTDHNSWAWLEA